MFTFKKFAAVGVAAFAAFTFSCSDTDDDGDGTTPKDYGFSAEKADIQLGGSGSTTGSSLDIDDNFKVYSSGQLTAAVAANIDLVFSGTVIYTPAGAVANNYLANSLAGGATNGVFFFDVPSSTSTANDLVDAFQASDDELTAITPANGKKFGVLTSDEALALVIINDKGSAATVLKIDVKRIDE